MGNPRVLRRAGVRRIFKPQLPPYALLHYKAFDLVCSELDGVCEFLQRASGEDALVLAYERPQAIRAYLTRVVFKGPYARLWRRLQLDDLPASFERWPRADSRHCPKLVWRASPSVFLMSPERMYQHVVRSTTLVRRLRELGIRLWEYDEGKRVLVKAVVRPWGKIRLVMAAYPPAELLGSCGYHAAASMKYWADVGGVWSVDAVVPEALDAENMPKSQTSSSGISGTNGLR